MGYDWEIYVPKLGIFYLDEFINDLVSWRHWNDGKIGL